MNTIGPGRQPLVLTGGPAVGKSTTAGLLAQMCFRAAVIDVDHIRQLIVSGHAAPWAGAEGFAQQQLGVENGCILAQRFHTRGFDVVITDVVTPVTLRLYRQLLPRCLVVRLHLNREEAERRAASRPVHLTDAEFDYLHTQDRTNTPLADHHLEVTRLDAAQQADVVAEVWNSRV